MTEVEEKLSIYGLIPFSGKTKKGKAISLISPEHRLKFNMERDIYKKVHQKTPIATSQNDTLDFSISCTKKHKQSMKKERCHMK